MRTIEDFLKYTVDVGGCLEWQRCFNTDGYPRCFWNGNPNGKVHRIIMELSGVNTTGLVVRHRCDNIRCINPKHLLVGTPTDNMRDRVKRDRCYRVIKGNTVKAVKDLLHTGEYTQKQIAELLSIDPRRVSEIYLCKRKEDGRLVDRVKRRE